MTFAEFGREQVGEFDLADFAFDFIVSHLRFEIMFEAVLAQELNKKFLREIGVSGGGAFFNQQAGASRGPHQRMVRNDAVQFRPEAVHVGQSQALDPLAAFRHALRSAFGARSLRLLTDWRQLDFFFDFVT